ncbi:MAG: hypothetical protein CMD39_07245 [Gammaproteobacteria bacterium]|nr:hypothetical protein [Gammaproteobacteria bacterium]
MKNLKERLRQLRGRKAAVADEAARTECIELLDRLEELQTTHPGLAGDPDVRQRMTRIVTRGLSA